MHPRASISTPRTWRWHATLASTRQRSATSKDEQCGGTVATVTGVMRRSRTEDAGGRAGMQEAAALGEAASVEMAAVAALVVEAVAVLVEETVAVLVGA
eukprot:6203807-Pleurochrysis_carterae.AAC.3